MKAENLVEATNVLTQLQQLGQISAIGQATALWTMRLSWSDLFAEEEFINTDERDTHFYNWIFAVVGYMPDTVRRYCLAWQFVHDYQALLTEDQANRLQNRDIKDLIALGQHNNEHNALRTPELIKLLEEPDHASLRQGLRRLRGEAGPEDQLALEMDQAGTLLVRQGGQVEPLGYLADGENELVKRGRARLIRKGGIKET